MGAGANAALPAAYQRIAEVKNLAADRALLAALPQLTPAERRGALGLLMHRRRTPALVDLLSRFDEFNKTDQQFLVEQSALFPAAARAAISSDSKAARLGAIQLILRSADSALVYLLPAALRNPCSTTRRCAARALADIVHGFINQDTAGLHAPANAAPTNARTSARTRLAHAADQALRSWDIHRRPEVIDAAMMLWSDIESTLIELAANARSRFCIAMEERMYRLRDPSWAGFYLCSLRSDRLASTAARALSRCDDNACLDTLFDAAWLLGDPAIQRECGRIRDASWLKHGRATLQALSTERLTGALDLLMALGVDQSRKVALLEELAESTDGCASEAACWRLVEIRTEQTDGILDRWKRHAAGRLSALADRELQRRHRRPDAGHRLVAPTNANRIACGTPMRSESVPASPKVTLTSGDNGRSGHTGESYGPFDGSHAHLGWKLGASDATDRMHALTLIRQERLHNDFADRMGRLVHDNNAQVRSLAVAMVGETKLPAGRQIACRAMSDPDGRVQANAIEAIDRLSPAGGRLDGLVMLRDRLQSDVSRVRANAVVVLLRREDNAAAEALIDMLECDAPAHRIAGLWVVEHMRLQSMLDRAQRMVRDDPDARVRRRAERVLQLRVAHRTGSATTGDTAVDAIEITDARRQ